MQINKTGIELIKKFEGLRLKKYRCPAGYWTIGYGHCLKPDESFETITIDDAEYLLQEDLKLYTANVTKLITSKINNNQFSALISFAYNVGCGNFSKSTLLKKVNKGLHLEVPAELIKWVHVNKVPYKGLLLRRAWESALYMEY